MSTKKRIRKPFLMKANEQYCLDFGQKNIDPIKCKVCGMLFVVGEESDENQHLKFHADFEKGVRWSTKYEKPRKYLDDGSRIISIGSDEPKTTYEAVNKLLTMSESDMSPGDDVYKLVSNKDHLFLLYVTPTNYIVGYICVELIKEAYHLVDFESSRLSSETYPAECGILYLWIHPSFRRKGIATWLTDIARANLKKEGVIPRSRVAVCDPTEMAVPFLKAYLLQKRPVKVYQK